jgi:protein-disulfide isomerase
MPSVFFSIIIGFFGFLGVGHEINIVSQPVVTPPFTNIIEMPPVATVYNPDTAIRIDIFDHLQCASCQHFMLNVLPALKAKNNVEVRIYLQPDVNEERELMAALRVKCAADQGKFWEAHTALHKTNGELTSKALADEFELDFNALKACVENQDHRDAIDKDIAYAKEKNVAHLPSVIIRNLHLIGNQPLENIERILKQF